MRRSTGNPFRRPDPDTTGQETPMPRRGPVLLAVAAAVCLAAITGGVVTVASALQQPPQVTEIGSTPVVGPSRAPGAGETPGADPSSSDPAGADPAATDPAVDFAATTAPAAPAAPAPQSPPAEQGAGTAPVPVVPVPAPAPADGDDDGDDEDTDDPDDDVDDDTDD
ncbi:hypothetical protein [Rathayibacter festucae]|uniref:hypothetical protein n=1 Tax=Rathayibacter festucae TaxID=110937 RepID=UPI002A69F0DB|nr:hypothetical protein [Rathayibacter festucae]MDY0913117.1 hypothetical protein [Rathayibacter festucae]